MEHSMKTRFLISKIRLVFNLQLAILDSDLRKTLNLVDI